MLLMLAAGDDDCDCDSDKCTNYIRNNIRLYFMFLMCYKHFINHTLEGLSLLLKADLYDLFQTYTMLIQHKNYTEWSLLKKKIKTVNMIENKHISMS